MKLRASGSQEIKIWILGRNIQTAVSTRDYIKYASLLTNLCLTVQNVLSELLPFLNYTDVNKGFVVWNTWHMCLDWPINWLVAYLLGGRHMYYIKPTISSISQKSNIKQRTPKFGLVLTLQIAFFQTNFTLGL